MADTNLRRFIEGLLEIARKNGKSTMLAADGTADLFIGQGGSVMRRNGAKMPSWNHTL